MFRSQISELNWDCYLPSNLLRRSWHFSHSVFDIIYCNYKCVFMLLH